MSTTPDDGGVIERFEARLGRAISLHPNALSALKLVVTVAVVAGLDPFAALSLPRAAVLGGFALFGVLDYLDGVVARARGLDTRFGRVFDRLTDLPLVATVAWIAIDMVPVAAIAAKLALDVALVVLYLLGRGSTRNRVRTGIAYAALGAMLLVSQGWARELVHPRLVAELLWLNVAFSSVVVLANLGILQKRFIADALSAANLACGVLGIRFAAAGRVDLTILFLLVGAAFDGFDGAAARRWGGTRFGVFSDDIADGVNYGIAPGLAIGFTLDSPSGWIVGAVYSVFTISRLVYFTLAKGKSDPALFAGVPSTVGGLVTLCALFLFPTDALFVGLFVGAACVLMVSFDTQHRHLGRAFGGLWARRSRALYLAPAWIVGFVVAGATWGVAVPITALLVAGLGYGLWPVVVAFRRTRPPATAQFDDLAR